MLRADGFLDAVNDVADVVIGDVGAGGEAETDLEEIFLDTVGVGYHVRTLEDTRSGLGRAFAVDRLLVHMHPRHRSKQFLVECLHMLVVRNMITQHSHLAAADTSTYVAHAVVVADGSMHKT